MSLSSDEVETVVSSFREGVKAHPRQTAREIVEDIALQLPEGEVNPADYIGIVLIDGLSLGELLMKEFTTAKKFTFPIVGGAAADELTFTETLVAHNSIMSSDGAAVAVMKMKVPFSMIILSIICLPGRSSLSPVPILSGALCGK